MIGEWGKVLQRSQYCFTAQKRMFCNAISNRWLEDAAYWHADCIVDGEFLAADVE